MTKFRTLEFTMKKYLLFYLVISPCILFSNSPEQPMIPSEMLLSSENSIPRSQVDNEQSENDEELNEELTDASPECSSEDYNPLS